MLVELATRATCALFPGEAHREMRGVKRRWIGILRGYPEYYRTLYRTHRQSRIHGELAQIHLEATNGCNLKCKICNSANSPMQKGLMPFDLACRIIDEAWSELGVEGKFGLFIRGESVLHPQLAEIIAYAQKKGFSQILLSTNLMLLSEERARKLLSAGLSELRLSIDAVEGQEFETERVGARFKVIVENLESLWRVRQELQSPCTFRLHAALHRRNFERIPEFVRRWAHLIQIFRFTVAVNQGGLFTQEEALKFSGLRFAVSTDYQIPCRILYDYIGVTWDGKLTSCCVDYREQFIAGNFADGIKAGFKGEKARQIRLNHLHGRFGPLCSRCGFNNVLVDWFEDEVNDYVSSQRQRLMNPKFDSTFLKKLNKMIDKFEHLANTPPPPRTYFGEDQYQ